MDYTKLTYDELISFCKENNIDYLNKQKKPYAHKSLLTKLKKSTQTTEDIDKNIQEENLDFIVKKCHNYLYSNGAIVGSKAQNDIMKLLILKIINILYTTNEDFKNKLDDKIKIIRSNNLIIKDFSDRYNNNYDLIQVSIVKKKIEYTIKKYDDYNKYIANINELLIHNPDDIINVWKTFIDDYMCKLLPDIYNTSDNIFNAKKGYDIKELIRIINYVKITNNFMNNFASFNGDIHESFLKYQGNKNSKELGQYFTPRLLIKAILDECGLKELITNIEKSNPTIYDPCMGTGGLLCFTYNNCDNKIKNDGLYGCEIEFDTIKFGVASIMISTNEYNSNIKNCNSLIENPYLFENKKFDIIFTNPPFGTKNNYKQLNINFDEYKKNNYKESIIKFEDIYPIYTNKGTYLFVQNIIYSLADNGIACIVLPDGEMMKSNNDNSLKIRKFILDNAKIIKIINVNGGIFMNTSIKTKVLIIQKGNYDNYNCEVDFLDIINIDDKITVKHLETKKINENLHFSSSIDEEDEINYSKDIEIKTIGEICTFLPKSKRHASYGKVKGKYPFYTSSKNCNKYCDEYDYEDECLIIGTGGTANIKYCCKFSCSADNFVIKINTGYSPKYIYYYILINIEILQTGFIGVGIQHISKEYLNNIKMPIPSIEKQNEIVKYLDFIYEKANKTSNEKITELKQLNEFCLSNQKIFGENVVKELGKITTYKSGKRLPLGHLLQNNKTPYPYIRITDIDKNSISLNNIKYISQETKDIINKYIITTNDIYITIAGTTGLVGIIPNELDGANLTENAVRINIVNKNEILQKYLVYDIHYNQPEELKTKTIGAAIPKLSIERLMTLQIPVPSIECQKKIVEYCEYNDTLIKQLEKEIENNKKQAELFMKNCLL
jgi:type I restriction enzyme S subunit